MRASVQLTVLSFKKIANKNLGYVYPIPDSFLSTMVWTPIWYVTLCFRDQRNWSPLQKSHQSYRCYVWTEALSSMILCRRKSYWRYSVNIALWCTGALSNVYDSYFKCLTGLPFDIKTNQPASTTPPFPSGGLVCLITSTITDPLSVLVLRISSSLLLGGDKTKGKERKNS